MCGAVRQDQTGKAYRAGGARTSQGEWDGCPGRSALTDRPGYAGDRHITAGNGDLRGDQRQRIPGDVQVADHPVAITQDGYRRRAGTQGEHSGDTAGIAQSVASGDPQLVLLGNGRFDRTLQFRGPFGRVNADDTGAGGTGTKRCGIDVCRFDQTECFQWADLNRLADLKRRLGDVPRAIGVRIDQDREFGRQRTDRLPITRCSHAELGGGGIDNKVERG